ncbi:MAG TPA: response regulator [Candidatus Omnitrophota bacterium]|jgi:DNA-binding NtrC family response regulator|nr:response regulator [Candidatus Omnitrophota bacterium]HRZ14799.1 response regulator [Candidatus Omnitrophota bacterium]
MPKMLIVDDEEDVREFAANFFRKRKIDTRTAGSGEEALNKVKEDRPDLVLLDIRMGGMNGIQTLEAIKKLDATIKAVMVTGTRPEENESYNTCVQLGACGYVHKPLKLEELEQVVMKALNP